MVGKRQFKRFLFILIVKCFNKHTYHIFIGESTFSNCCPTFLYSEFQGITEGFVSGDSIQFLTSSMQCILKRPYTNKTLSIS